MPRFSCWAVRGSLIYLALGFTIGALILVSKAMPLYPGLWRLLPAHIEFLLMGWMAQLAMGVGFWILPRFAGGASRGKESVAWLAWILLNVGVLLFAFGPALEASAVVLLSARITEAGGAAAFVVHAWLRVKGPSV